MDAKGLYGDTPLHLSFYIAERVPDFIHVSEYLVDHGANIAAINQQGASAIDSCPPQFRESMKDFFVSVRVRFVLFKAAVPVPRGLCPRARSVARGGCFSACQLTVARCPPFRRFHG